MSDDDKKKPGGYRLEYASSGRAKCKDEHALEHLLKNLCPKPCNGTAIQKGELRLGTQVDFRGNTSFAWRHWGCITPQIIANFKKSVDSAEDLDGFEDLKEEDRERVVKAWEEGQVAEEDIPESARKAGSDDEEAGGPKKKKKATSGTKKKKGEDKQDEDKKPAKKAPARTNKKKKKAESDESGEDFADEIDQVEDDDEEEEVVSKKRKRAAPKNASGSKKANSKAKKSATKKASDDDDD